MAITPITDSAELKEFCRRQSRASYVTVDTEFLRDTTYWPVLCLVQIAGPEEAAAIDALADGLDLDPLYRLLADESLPGPLRQLVNAMEGRITVDSMPGRGSTFRFPVRFANATGGPPRAALPVPTVEPRHLLGRQPRLQPFPLLAGKLSSVSHTVC